MAEKVDRELKSMPFANFRNFRECMRQQQKRGYSKKDAGRICGFIEQRSREAHNSLDDLATEELLAEHEAAGVVWKQLAEGTMAWSKEEVIATHKALHTTLRKRGYIWLPSDGIPE